jgi:hypothetical protein
MQIGYITFNSEERQRVMKVLQLVRDQNAIDELGLGRIRDAFANEMFPGMSTLQRRAKYFAVLPSLYHEATKMNYRNPQEVRKQIIHWEIRLTEMLINGCGISDEKMTGITGSSTLEAAKRDETKYVKYDPTYIYQNGMRLYGMIRGNVSLEKLIFDQSVLRKKYPERYTNLDTSSDAEEQFGIKQVFVTCGEAYDFENGDKLPIQLTYKEAAFLKNHIETSHNSKDSLLAYLLKNEIDVKPYFADFEKTKSIMDNLPEHFQRQYKLALHFSNWAKYMHLRYRYLFALGNGNIEDKNSWEGQMKNLLDDHNEILDEQWMYEVLQYVDNLVLEPTVKQFCMEAAILLYENKQKELDELIKKREKRIKGKRHKIDNPKYINYSMGNPSTMSFRWNEIVHQVITDIRNGYGKK